MKISIFKFAFFFWGVFMFTSCLKDLEIYPDDKDIVLADQFYSTPNAYRDALAKLYAGYATTGQNGPSGQPDITGIDEGFSQYLRQYWQAQELPTDEAVIGWADGSLPDFHEMDWNRDNEFLRALYDRIYYQITSCNEYIRQTSDAKLSERGVQEPLLSQVKTYRNEARFLRALSYFHALDLYGNVPFVTENDPVGYFLPDQISRANLFNYIETELLAIEPLLIGARQNEYARADKAAVWMLLARLYLNAKVYTGTDRYDSCLTNVNKVIGAGYILDPNYRHLFMADNHLSTEIIFPIAFDGLRTQTWGGTTYLVHAAIGGSMNPADFGVNSGWGGLRTTSAFVAKFPSPDPNILNNSLGAVSTWGIVGDATPNSWSGPDIKLRQDGSVLSVYATLANGSIKIRQNDSWSGTDYGGSNGTLVAFGSNIAVTAGTYKITINFAASTYSITPVGLDGRANFHTAGQTLDIINMGSFSNGYAIKKYSNKKRDGSNGSDASGNFTDTDFPMFRLADAYLMYAECAARGVSGASTATAATYVNLLRQRAYGNTSGNITASDISQNFILDERARELYWEGYRRTDLIRFNRFTEGTYLWPWKGGVAAGTAVADFRKLYPIPSSDMNANPKLVQNTGY